MTPHSLCGVAETITFSCVTPTIIDSGTDAGATAALDTPDAAIDAPIDAPIDANETCADNIPIDIQALDTDYICGSTTTATATSMRIDGLTNGVPYQVALLAIDKSGNPAGVFMNATITPEPVTDFWDDLHNRGSHVEGGFCLINDTFGDDSGIANELRAFRDDTLRVDRVRPLADRRLLRGLRRHRRVRRYRPPLQVFAAVSLAPAIFVAVAWHHLTLPGLLALLGLLALAHNRRRILARRGVRVALTSAGAVLAILALPQRAHAQADYWQHADGSAVDDGVDTSQPNTAVHNAGSDDSWNTTTNATGLDTSQANTAVNNYDESAPLGPPISHWHAGVRVGPYTPQIDAQLGGPSPGPYKQMSAATRSCRCSTSSAWCGTSAAVSSRPGSASAISRQERQHVRRDVRRAGARRPRRPIRIARARVTRTRFG